MCSSGNATCPSVVSCAGVITPSSVEQQAGQLEEEVKRKKGDYRKR